MSLAQLRKPKMTDTSPLYTERLTAEEEKQMAREIRKAEQEAELSPASTGRLHPQRPVQAERHVRVRWTVSKRP